MNALLIMAILFLEILSYKQDKPAQVELRKKKIEVTQCTTCQLVLKAERATHHYTRDEFVFCTFTRKILFFLKSLTIFFKLKRQNAQRSWDRGRQRCPKNKTAQGEKSTE